MEHSQEQRREQGSRCAQPNRKREIVPVEANQEHGANVLSDDQNGREMISEEEVRENLRKRQRRESSTESSGGSSRLFAEAVESLRTWDGERRQIVEGYVKEEWRKLKTARVDPEVYFKRDDKEKDATEQKEENLAECDCFGIKFGVTQSSGLVEDVEDRVDSVIKRSFDPIATLSRLLWDHCHNNILTNALLYKTRKNTAQLLIDAYKYNFRGEEVFIRLTGSSINNCESGTSAGDVCFFMPMKGHEGHSAKNFEYREEFLVEKQKKIRNMIHRLPGHNELKKMVKSNYIRKNTESLMLELEGNEKFSLSIKVNEVNKLYNSHLLHYYSQIDLRLPAISFYVIDWAESRIKNNARQWILHREALQLLAVHFLQCGVYPPLLPSLNHVFPERFNGNRSPRNLELFVDILAVLPKLPQNQMSVGELLIGFFNYYNKFDFKQFGISIREGKRVEKPEGSIVFVEDPFSGLNAAKNVHLTDLEDIKKEFKATSRIFKKRDFTVQEIGVRITEHPTEA